MKMGQNHARFKKILKGKIRQNLKKYISQGEMIGKIGKDKVSIPVPHIDMPRFRLDPGETGGIGQGDGQPGDAIGKPGQPGPGSGKAGQGEGEHTLEVEVSLEELADILGEELQLPNIKPKGSKNIEETDNRYTGIAPVGNDSLIDFKRTYKQALKREIASGTWSPTNSAVIPIRRDYRYKTADPIVKPQAQAVIIYMMDVSGSMGSEQKNIVRTIAFWIDTWLTKQYKGLEKRFIIHDTTAKEVDKETFFTTKESGGTMISSALKLCNQIIKEDYCSEEWNVYPMYFSDGDNWSSQDTQLCIDLLRDEILPIANMVAYGQVESPYGSGQFMEDLRVNFKDENQAPHMMVANMKDREDILDAIKIFLGKGH